MPWFPPVETKALTSHVIPTLYLGENMTRFKKEIIHTIHKATDKCLISTIKPGDFSTERPITPVQTKK